MQVRPDISPSVAINAGWKCLFALETVSVDVAAGALGCTFFVASFSRSIHLSLPLLAVLASTILVVYNLDHFLDSSKIDPFSTPRRNRYRDHRAWLVAVGVGSMLCALMSLYFIPANAWLPGVFLAGYQGLYFAGLKAGVRGVAKRIMAAFGWAAGLGFPAWLDAGNDRPLIVFVCILFASLGWINLQSYALMESKTENDRGAVPGLLLRSLAIASSLILIACGVWLYPDHDLQWMALLVVCLVQISLTRIPLRFVHPVGEWSLALLGLFALAF